MHADSARPPVMKVSLAIASEFRERIARGELRNGDPLPVESQLVDELGVSKGTVREALRILEMQGLVEMRRGVGGGPRVRHPDLSEAAIPMGVYLQIGDVQVMDVWVARDRIIGGPSNGWRRNGAGPTRRRWRRAWRRSGRPLATSMRTTRC